MNDCCASKAERDTKIDVHEALTKRYGSYEEVKYSCIVVRRNERKNLLGLLIQLLYSTANVADRDAVHACLT